MVATATLQPGGTFDQVVNLFTGHTYQIRSAAYGDVVTGTGVVFYRPGNISTQYTNVNTGGLRVAKVITKDHVTTVSNVKKYLYSAWATPAISSGGPIYEPHYERYLDTYVRCNDGTPHDPSNPNGPTECDIKNYDFYSMYSNTQNNIYRYPSCVSYGSVIESVGENFEDGGIEHQFTIYEDQAASQILGNSIQLSSPLTSYSWKNAREVYKNVFKMNGTTQLPVQKVFTTYKEDPRKDKDFKSYLATKKYSVNCVDNVPSQTELEAYDVYSYSHFYKWVYVDTVKTWDYDVTGQNYIEHFDIVHYDNPSHALPTKKVSFTSKADRQEVVTNYPDDIVLTGSEETARQALIARNMVSSVMKQTVNNLGGQLFTLQNKYFIFPNTYVQLQSKTIKIGSHAPEERLVVQRYNNFGKLVEQSQTNNLHTSYIWSDNSLYPLASVTNADAQSIAYTSFEAEGNGNWTVGNTARDIGQWVTGKQCYNLAGGNISKSDLINGTVYKICYWSTNGAKSITGGTSSTKAGRTNGVWTYYEHQITMSSSGVTISGSGLIDELRLYPVGSQMTSYTYEPLIGQSSVTDPSGLTTLYEYDNFNRLKNIKDYQGNIVKNFQYNYFNSDSLSGPLDSVHFGITEIFQDNTSILKNIYSQVFSNGIAHISPTMVAGTPYANSNLVLQKNDTLCVNDDFTIEVRYKYDSSITVNYCEGGNFVFWYNDLNSYLTSNINLKGTEAQSCAWATYIRTNGITVQDTTNSSMYFKNLDWIKLKYVIKNGIGKVYINDTLTTTFSYSVPMNKIVKYAFGIRYGYADYVKVYDSNGVLKYSEEFEDSKQSLSNTPSAFQCIP